MKYLTPLLCSLVLVVLLSFNASAQKLQFKVIHEENLKALENVTVKSSAHGTFYTDASGHFSLTYKDHDTLTLSKEHYHTIHYIIEAKNFDAAHTISLSMAALAEDQSPSSITSDISSLQKFDYHFVHDKPGNDSYLKIHALESIPASQSRANQKEFKIGAVPLNHTQLNHTNGQGAYKLK